LFLWDWWEGFTGAFSLGGITWLSYALYVLLLGGIAGFLLAQTYGMRKASLATVLTAGILLVIAGTVLAAKVGELHRSDEAVVTVAITTAKNSPDVKSSDAFVLHAGVKVRITDRVHGWINIRLADGKVGWVEEKAAELI
jgi:DMSO reductase anchor subunit